ncbi:hypothetical protein HPB48_005606 [Haemaphysalis longicornis]|uniref:Uncharacterized protein n=1 Tax=Haemaphysalis longicornis TaxID=44386 RepID=A0A9J6G7B1_HAELO|nr:hypothetical protein HPB48_005606 [Haemaphysalis longicornis]
MYLGLSFLVIFEILEIFVRWFIYLYKRRHASVAPQQQQQANLQPPSEWQRRAEKANEAARGGIGKRWPNLRTQRSCWEIMKDPRISAAAAAATGRSPAAPHYGYFDSSDWKSAVDEKLGPFNPALMHRNFRPGAFYF